jgi:PAS domain S-box-containing protein
LNRSIKILHLEDSIYDAELISYGLRGSGFTYEYLHVADRPAYIRALDEYSPDVVLSDHRMPLFSSLQAFELARSRHPGIPFIIITGVLTEDDLSRLMDQGMDDFLTKDRLQRLPSAILHAVERARTETDKREHFAELQRKEKRFRALTEHSRDGILLLDVDFRISYSSPAVEQIIHLQPESISGFPFSEIFHSRSAAPITELLKNALNADLITFNKILKIRRLDGSELWLDISVTNLLRDKEVDGIVVNFSDVTRRLVSEKLLKGSEANLRNILENTDTAYVLLDRNRNVVLFNAQAGFLVSELMNAELKTGIDYTSLIPEQRRKSVKDNIEEVLHSAKRIRYETSYPLGAGRTLWLQVNMHPIQNEESNITGLSIAATNITEGKEAQQILSASEANLKTVFNNTNISYVFADRHFNLVSFNRTAEIAYRKELKAILKIGENLLKYLPDYRREEGRQRYEKVLKGETINYEINFAQDDGSHKWYNVNILPVHSEERKLLGLLIASENISERKLSELEKEKMNAYIIRRNKDLEQFAYIISHNLRSPVANITGLVTLLTTNTDLSEEELSTCMKGLTLSVKKLDQVIIDLNYILQVRRESQDKKEFVRFSELADDIRTTLAHLFEIGDIRLSLDFSAAEGMTCIKSYLHSIFYNLISNSIKYRRPVETEISIRSAVENKVLRLVFSDNGQGIDLDRHRDKIFGLYKQFTTGSDGKGMGLYLVKTEVEMMGGIIRVESTPGEGTRFIIDFPL